MDARSLIPSGHLAILTGIFERLDSYAHGYDAARREFSEVDVIEAPVEESSTLKLKAPKPKAPAKTNQAKADWVPPYNSHPHLPPSKRILMYPRPLTPLDLANEVGVNRETLYLWIKADTIPFRLAGRHKKIDPGPAAEWAEQCEFSPARLP